MRDTFGDFRRSTKILIWILLGLGVTLFAVCLHADLTGARWMEKYAYIPNILAGLTGFLLGVPFALVVFAAFASQREDKAADDRVNVISQIAWDQYRNAITTLCSPERIEALRLCAKHISDIHDATWQGFNRYTFDHASQEEFNRIVAFAESQSNRWAQAVGDMMQQVGVVSDLRLQWFAAVRDWNTLDQYVRLQRLERGLHWFHRELDSLLQERMVVDRHPMQPVFDMHDGADIRGPLQPNDMGSALARVSGLSQLGYSQGTFDQVILDEPAHFPTTRVEAYLDTAEDVAHQMGMLYAFVQQVDRSGWPAHAPENPPLAS